MIHLFENRKEDGMSTYKEESQETLILAIPSKGRTRYRLSSLLNYCLENEKELEELTDEEKAQFVIVEN